MRKTELQEYQEELKLKLNQVFFREIVQTEWSSMINERDLFIYSPRIDVAVGPLLQKTHMHMSMMNLLIMFKFRIF
ncbi:hypothetical protein J7E73_08405 [Paenibacillus albidus]|nr:hypothetical protein [Paenibacillus albidus]